MVSSLFGGHTQVATNNATSSASGTVQVVQNHSGDNDTQSSSTSIIGQDLSSKTVVIVNHPIKVSTPPNVSTKDSNSIMSGEISAISQASVTVTSPKQGDIFAVGDSIPIRWSGNWSGNDVFSIIWAGNPSIGSIVENVTQSQVGCSGVGKDVCNFSWNPPSSATGLMQIQVTDITMGQTVHSGTFTITAPIINSTSQPIISSITPNQGTANTVVTISGSGMIGATKIDFYGTNNQLLGSIANSVQGNINVSSDGTSLQFTLDDAFAYNVDGNLQLRVVTPKGQSNTFPFTITSPNPSSSGSGNCPVGFNCGNGITTNPVNNTPQITVISPSGGEVYHVDQPITVRFSSTISAGADVILRMYNGNSPTSNVYDFGFVDAPDHFTAVSAGSNTYTFTPTGYMLGGTLYFRNGTGTFRIEVIQPSTNNQYVQGSSGCNFQITYDATSSVTGN